MWLLKKKEWWGHSWVYEFPYYVELGPSWIYIKWLASYFEIIYGLNLLGKSGLALADNFCYVKIHRLLSWLKEGCGKWKSKWHGTCFICKPRDWYKPTRFLLVVSIGLLLLLLVFPLRRPFFKFGTKRELVILVLASSIKINAQEGM